MAGFEGYSIEYSNAVSGNSSLIPIPMEGFKGYSVEIANNISGGYPLPVYIGFIGYSVDDYLLNSSSITVLDQ